MREVAFDGSYVAWREQARGLVARDVDPGMLLWSTGAGQAAFDLGIEEEKPTRKLIRVPRDFLTAAESVSLHRDDDRWSLLYRVLYRITHGEPHLWQVDSDADVIRIHRMSHAVGRDIHKMHAFVRFRQTADGFAAWHRPDHHLVEATAPFFVRRFGAMRWAILTPERSAYWDLNELRFGPGVPRSAAPEGDELEELWLAYYASIFNPARVKVTAMKAELPVRHWATLPEAALIPGLLLDAQSRVHQMAASQPVSAQATVPAGASLPVLQQALATCTACPLHRGATQSVPGEGPANARIVVVGEQPGDIEDQHGRPFIGPAGQLLDRALRDAGVDREQLYLTNAVKHFKFEERGKRRIHQKPNGAEVNACRPWLEAEIAAIQPAVLVCLGATAARSLLGREVKIQSERGEFVPHHRAQELFITVHPSALLRMPDEASREAEYARFVTDWRQVKARYG
jgi:probable DNA metabolism protein